MEERDLRALYAYLKRDEGTRILVRRWVAIIHDNKTDDKKNEATRLKIIRALFPGS